MARLGTFVDTTVEKPDDRFKARDNNGNVTADRPLAHITAVKLPDPRLLTMRTEDVTFLIFTFTTSKLLSLFATPASHQISYGARSAFAVMANVLADVILTRQSFPALLAARPIGKKSDSTTSRWVSTRAYKRNGILAAVTRILDSDLAWRTWPGMAR